MKKLFLYCLLLINLHAANKEYSVVHVDPQRIQLFGINTAKIAARELTKKIRTYGFVDVAETKIVHVQTKFTGWIEELYVDFVGKPVKKGQPLFKVYSQELYATQEEYLLALNDLKRQFGGRFATELKKASESLLLSAKKRFELWDITPEEINALEQRGKATKSLTFFSPIDGIVIAKKAFVGMNIEPGLNVYTIADLSYIWILADIYENDIQFIKLNQAASLNVTSLPDKIFKGKVTFIDYVVNTSTRTTRVRFEFENDHFLLKPGMYATVMIDLPLGKHLALPEEALIDTGLRKIVFVEKEKGMYEPREVTLGSKADQYYEIITGLKEGESVVTSSQFLLDSESRIKSLEKKDMPEHR